MPFDKISEFIIGALLEPAIYCLFAVPVAISRWLISRLWKSEKSLRVFLREDIMLNGLTGLLIVITGGVLYAASH